MGPGYILYLDQHRQLLAMLGMRGRWVGSFEIQAGHLHETTVFRPMCHVKSTHNWSTAHLGGRWQPKPEP